MVWRLLVESLHFLTRFRYTVEINLLKGARAVDAAVGGNKKKKSASARRKGKASVTEKLPVYSGGDRKSVV